MEGRPAAPPLFQRLEHAPSVDRGEARRRIASRGAPETWHHGLAFCERAALDLDLERRDLALPGAGADPQLRLSDEERAYGPGLCHGDIMRGSVSSRAWNYTSS